MKRTMSNGGKKAIKKSKKVGNGFFTDHSLCYGNAEIVVVLGTRLNCIFDTTKGLFGVLFKMKGDKVDESVLNKLGPEGKTKDETVKTRMDAIKKIKNEWLDKAAEFTDVEKIKEAFDVEKAGWEPEIERMIALSFFSSDYESVLDMIRRCGELGRGEEFTEAGVDEISDQYECVEENFSTNVSMEMCEEALEAMLAGEEIVTDDFNDLSDEGFLVDLEEAQNLSNE